LVSSFFSAGFFVSLEALAYFFSHSALAASSLAIFRQSALVSFLAAGFFSPSALGASAGLAAGVWATAIPAMLTEKARLTSSAIIFCIFGSPPFAIDC